MEAWVVRSGGITEPDISDKFEANSVAAIDYGLGDVSRARSPQELESILRNDNPDLSERQRRQIALFLFDVDLEDWIVTPPTGRRGDVLIGRCQGPCEYWPEWMSGEYTQTRKVTWLKRLPRSAFPEKLLNSLNGQGTVFKVSKHLDTIVDLLGESVADDVAPMISPAEPYDMWSQDNVDALTKELLWEPHHLQGIIDDLQEKRQVIFYGPPGTGKTYVAKRLAEHCLESGGDFEIVQFHPSYSYEDFVEGYRPRLFEGQPGFNLVEGPLKRIAKQAAENPESTFILVIDELNRGNVAKVFGELYFLLEYRGEEVRLQYGEGGKRFSLPPNLWFICTMNTVDRSIALMDAALRRRFYFEPFFPAEPPIKGLLRRWLDKQGWDNWVADLVDLTNKKLERDMGIGPSYFMDTGRFLDEERARRIWERAVMPYVEEQFYGDDARLRQFEFDRLKRELDGASSLDDTSTMVDDADSHAE